MNWSKVFSPNNILLAVIASLGIGLLVFIGFSARVDVLEEAMENQESVGMLFVVHDQGKPLVSEAMFFHTVTGRMVVFDLPFETGALISSLGKMALLTDLFQVGDPSVYKEQIQVLLGQKMDFSFPIEIQNLEKVVDLVGGVDLFLSDPMESVADEEIVLLPAGSVPLEGPKIKDYLYWEDSTETGSDKSVRYQRFFQAFLRQISDQSSWLSKGEALGFFQKFFAPGYEKTGLGKWIEFLGKADTEGMIFQRVLGSVRDVDGRDILFPHYNGNLLREGVQQALKAIGDEEGLNASAMNLQLEILNGTAEIGLASRAATVYSSMGITVGQVGNAESSEYGKTVVLDRRGNLAAAQRVAQAIRCGNILSDETTLREGGPDITLILGADFDGRYVR